MAGNGNSAAQAIKARINIVDVVRRYVELRRIGARWMAPCPFHQETKPSFSVNEEQGFYYCFGCHASGDLIDFYSKINGLEFRDAIEQLAEEAGIDLKAYASRKAPNPREEQEKAFRKQCLAMYELAKKHFMHTLHSPEGADCREYIAGRRISPEIMQDFELGWSSREWGSLADVLRRAGYAPELAVKAGLLSQSKSGQFFDRFRGRFMFPIRNLSNQVIAFGGRIIISEDQAKYINSSDSLIYKKGEHLYGLAQARRAIAQHKTAFLTEGYMDVLTLHQYGYRNACGVLGTALTPEQVKRLSGFCSRVTLLFDGDMPGRKAALRSCEMLLLRGMDCRVVLLPDGEDIDSLLHTQGGSAFEALIEQAPKGLDYCVQVLSASFSPREIVDWAGNFLRQLESPELISFYVSRLAGGLGLNESELREHLHEDGRGQSAASQHASTLAARSGMGSARQGAKALSLEQRFERQLMAFIIRYPQYVPDLTAHGAEAVLVSQWAQNMWNIVAEHGENAADYFSEQQKALWIRCRVAEPVPQEHQAQELYDLCARLDEQAQKEQSNLMLAALRHLHTNANSDAGFELLRAMQDNLGGTHGEH